MANAGVMSTHFTFHRSSADGAFTVRPDFCLTCRNVVGQARRANLFRPEELEPHPDNPPTFGELSARLGQPLTRPEPGLLDPTFAEMMAANGYAADGGTQRG